MRPTAPSAGLCCHTHAIRHALSLLSLRLKDLQGPVTRVKKKKKSPVRTGPPEQRPSTGPLRNTLTHPSGHVRRDKWTALGGPLSETRHRQDLEDRQDRGGCLAYRGTSLIRNRPPP